MVEHALSRAERGDQSFHDDQPRVGEEGHGGEVLDHLAGGESARRERGGVGAEHAVGIERGAELEHRLVQPEVVRVGVHRQRARVEVQHQSAFRINRGPIATRSTW